MNNQDQVRPAMRERQKRDGNGRKASLTKVAPLSPEEAWKLWRQLNGVAETLWQTYKKEFTELCFNEGPSFRMPQVHPF
jgi:hypothetical protein